MPRRVVPLALLCLLVFAGRAAHASPQGREPDGKELRKAEAVISKLRSLEEVLSSGDADASARAAGRLYPGLYLSVAGLRDSDLKTDLSTAVALYESALRAALEGDGAAPDCSCELREAYARLCREAAGAGGRAGLLRAKARMHARLAGAELLYARGDRGAETLYALDLIRAERSTDRSLAEEALRVLEETVTGASGDYAPAGGAYAGGALQRGRAEMSSEDIAVRLEQTDRILASLPRDHTRQLLRGARDAFRDALYWRMKAAPSRALVVNANSFAAPDALPRLGLAADDADRASLANLRAALKFIRKAKEELGTR